MNPKVKKIYTLLNEFFPDPPIPLQHTSSYTLLIAVVLSARSQDRRVNQVTPFLFKRADTPEKMILMTTEEIQKIIQPCGLSLQKARAILQLSHQLLEKHQGLVPPCFEALEALPGVGHKTASVVMAQAFSIPAFPVDTHILRCSRRWGLSLGKTPNRVEKDLKLLFPKDSWCKLHLQMIEFARNYCKARRHSIQACPICSWIQPNFCA